MGNRKKGFVHKNARYWEKLRKTLMAVGYGKDQNGIPCLMEKFQLEKRNVYLIESAI